VRRIAGRIHWENSIEVKLREEIENVEKELV